MDYDQWTPLGRGDPLKNDPTYDYVPPVLERVHYWIEPSSRKPDPPTDPKKTEILVLGVSSKKPSVADSRRDHYDPYIQFVDGSNFNNNNYQRLQQRPQHYSYYSSKQPYTILVPPPMQKESIPYPTTTTTSSVSVDEANLIYQASSVSWKGSNSNNNNAYATIAEPSSQVTWRTPSINQTSIHKGHKVDDDLDLISTHINNPNTQVRTEVESLSTEPLTPPMKDAPVTFSASLFKKPLHTEDSINSPMTLQMTIQTMSPVSTTEESHNNNKKPSNFLHNLLKKEMKTNPPFVPTSLPPTTTSVSSLTTDPLFKHYKQPAEPLKGPLYLIIQGHSKVKTYGPSKQLNGIPVQETNEISTLDDLSNSNNNNNNQVKHLHRDVKRDEWKREGRSNGNKLQSLKHVVVTGLGAIDFVDRRSDVKETRLVVKYDVSDGEVTSEVYHKGIVESENPPSRVSGYSLLKSNNISGSNKKYYY